MQNILGPFLSFLLLYKYVALFLITFTASLALPVPSTTTLTAASAFASQGYLSFPLVLAIAVAGNIGGDIVGYLLAKRYGERVLVKIGAKRLLNTPYYLKLKNYILTYPRALIFLSRFFTSTGPLVNVLTALSAVPQWTFFTVAALGELMYVLLYSLLGYTMGFYWENNLDLVIKITLAVLAVGLLGHTIQVLVVRRERNHN